ncbi:MAG: ECF transporter S component [Oscillospiraceae bacterium]|jgi:uncharacterized membrane protein|nr:ECF transporter S component [Oscillospiraceae bacterium]
MKTNTKTLALSGVFAALICLFTMFLSVPVPGAGYVNLGDLAILLASSVVGLPAVAAAGVGSALADLFKGYPMYIPGTAVVKAAVALTAVLFAKRGRTPFFAVGAVAAELVMVAGYFLYEFAVWNFAYAVAAAPPNLAQAGVNAAAAILLFAPTLRLKRYLHRS